MTMTLGALAATVFRRAAPSLAPHLTIAGAAAWVTGESRAGVFVAFFSSIAAAP